MPCMRFSSCLSSKSENKLKMCSLAKKWAFGLRYPKLYCYMYMTRIPSSVDSSSLWLNRSNSFISVIIMISVVLLAICSECGFYCVRLDRFSLCSFLFYLSVQRKKLQTFCLAQHHSDNGDENIRRRTIRIDN